MGVPTQQLPEMVQSKTHLVGHFFDSVRKRPNCACFSRESKVRIAEELCYQNKLSRCTGLQLPSGNTFAPPLGLLTADSEAVAFQAGSSVTVNNIWTYCICLPGSKQVSLLQLRAVPQRLLRG